MLDGDHPPSRERPTVSDPIHLVEDRDCRITGPQEVRMKGMDPTVGPAVVHDCPASRDQGLASHLSTEHALAVLIRTKATEDVDLNRLKVQQGEEVVEGLGHPCILPSEGR
jgi:hypothetical protein